MTPQLVENLEKKSILIFPYCNRIQVYIINTKFLIDIDFRDCVANNLKQECPKTNATLSTSAKTTTFTSLTLPVTKKNNTCSREPRK